MADASSISAAIASTKAALDLLKAVRESGGSLERAEWKLKLADATEALADVKLHLVEAQDELATRDARLRELEAAFQAKNSIVRVNDAYYELGSDGQPHGFALCVRCWEVDHRQATLIGSTGVRGRDNVCPVCKTSYRDGHANTLP